VPVGALLFVRCSISGLGGPDLQTLIRLIRESSWQLARLRCGPGSDFFSLQLLTEVRSPSPSTKAKTDLEPTARAARSFSALLRRCGTLLSPEVSKVWGTVEADLRLPSAELA